MTKLGCCDSVEITSHTQYITTIDNHQYRVVIRYCKNCGSQKANSDIRHVK